MAAERDLAVGADVDEQPQPLVAHRGRSRACRRRCRRRRRRPATGRSTAGARGWTATPKSFAVAGGSSCAATMNGAIDSGSGSMPSASCIIVTLPTTTISYTSAGSTPASSTTSPASSASVSCARASSADSAWSSSIVADTRLMTSAPYGCWRLSIDCTAAGWPVSRSSSVATTVVVPRSNAIAYRRPVVSPGSTAISSSSQTTAVTSNCASRSVLPSVRSTSRLTCRLEVLDRVEHALDVRALVLQRRLLEHEMALLHGGPQDHVPADADQRRLRPRLQRRHVHDEVLARGRPAREPPAFAQLVGAERARVDRARPARPRRRSAPCTSCTCRGRRTSSRSRCRSSSRRRRSACRSGTRTSAPSGSKRRTDALRRRPSLSGSQATGSDPQLTLRVRSVRLKGSTPLGSRRGGLAGAVGGDPVRAPGVVPEQQVGGAHALHAHLGACS